MSVVSCVGYVGLGVRDLAAWEHFGTQVLGLQTAGRDDAGVLRLRMDDYLYRLALHQDELDDLAYVGLEVAGRAELTDIEARLEGIGVTCRRAGPDLAASRGVMGLSQFDGPDGVIYEAYYGAVRRLGEPFVPARPCSGFVTGDQGLGHLVLQTGDLEAALSFFCDGLGFRLSDVIERARGDTPMPVYFLHCNRRHHSIAITAAGRAPGRMHHIMIQARSLDDVGHTFDIVQETGVRLMRTLGRHVNDRMVSFYLQSPSGFGIEYGWDAIEVDDTTWSVRKYDRGSIWGHRDV